MLLRRARRVADHLQAVCIAVYVHSKEESAAVHAEDRPTVDRHLRFAENLHISTEVIHGDNRAQTLVDYARKNGVTQLFLNRSTKAPRRWFPGLDFTDQVLQQAQEMEVTVVGERNRQGLAASPYPEDEAGALMHAGYVRISPEMTIEEAIGEIRRQAGEVEMIYYAYVLDESEHLLGVLSFRELLSAERSRKVRERCEPITSLYWKMLIRRPSHNCWRSGGCLRFRCWIRKDTCWELSPARTLPD